ncbi:MAG: HRDC domain-containing protein [Rickettsiaceae bacterium]|nr:HRDC domain-containing protein [Rickettsiaceae bacterium]
MLFIDNYDKLEKIAKSLMVEDMIGIDTEFMRRDTYYAKLCLIQISTKSDIIILDPINLDISPLKPILTSPNIVKIIHASYQDLGIFYHIFKIPVSRIFDTQEAIKFLSIKNQISYRDACEKILSKHIEKEQQFRQWNKRPLPDDMKAYAAQDVEHLIALYERLKKLMEERSIYNNFCKFMESFSRDEFYKPNFENIWKKVKTNIGDAQFLRALKHTAAFREECAIKLDLPRVRVISDEDLSEVTKHLPQNIKEFRNICKRTSLKDYQIEKLVSLCSGLYSGKL